MTSITRDLNVPLTVLLTRPKAKSEQLASQLSEFNITSYIQPLFSYQSNASASEIKRALAADIVIFVSVAAVTYAHATYPLEELKQSNKHCFAIGKATALALREVGINDVITPQSPLRETSEGLLQLPQLQAIANKRIVIFRGNGGREHIANTLRGRGALLHYVESYQRLWKPLTQETLKRWKSNKINCIVATSNDILNTLVKLIDETKQPDHFWREECLWLVVSQRIEDNARQLGFNHVFNSHSANSQQLSETLNRLQLGTL